MTAVRDWDDEYVIDEKVATIIDNFDAGQLSAYIGTTRCSYELARQEMDDFTAKLEEAAEKADYALALIRRAETRLQHLSEEAKEGRHSPERFKRLRAAFIDGFKTRFRGGSDRPKPTLPDERIAWVRGYDRAEYLIGRVGDLNWPFASWNEVDIEDEATTEADMCFPKVD